MMIIRPETLVGIALDFAATGAGNPAPDSKTNSASSFESTCYVVLIGLSVNRDGSNVVPPISMALILFSCLIPCLRTLNQQTFGFIVKRRIQNLTAPLGLARQLWGPDMIFDFSGYRLRNRAYSEKPMTILDPEPRAMLSAITEIALIETGSRSAREHWQQIQLRNLLNHITQRSAFWRARIGSRKASDIDLASLPILTRQDLRTQVASEGPLLRAADGLSTKAHATSGSSGVPVQFFFSDINGNYNVIRSLAQCFLEGLDLSLNRTCVRPAAAPVTGGISVVKAESWLGMLHPLFKSGKNKHIEYFRLQEVRDKLVLELKKDDVGYLVAMPGTIERISTSFDLGFLKAANTAMWIANSSSVTQSVRRVFADLAIPVRANYSSEEVGMIGAECSKFAGYYHVATSNVIVEVVDHKMEVDGMNLGRVLVTHLHSYATPFIRYDLDDLACLGAKCPCGHNGPTIYNLYGRVSSAIKHRDGRMSPFSIRLKTLETLVDFTEYRIRQTAYDKIVIEFGGRSELKPQEIAAVSSYLQESAGPEFDIEIKASKEIDWGQSRKRLPFRCEI
jgi:phenylacetate-coenzyme A ligase PaaK-like adenylate-forming protein